MNERIDHGDIIQVQNFAIWQGETEKDLKHKAALYSLNLLNGVLSDIVAEKPLEPCGIQWEPHLYTQKQLDAAKTQELDKFYREKSNQPALKSPILTSSEPPANPRGENQTHQFLKKSLSKR